MCSAPTLLTVPGWLQYKAISKTTDLRWYGSFVRQKPQCGQINRQAFSFPFLTILLTCIQHPMSIMSARFVTIYEFNRGLILTIKMLFFTYFKYLNAQWFLYQQTNNFNWKLKNYANFEFKFFDPIVKKYLVKKYLVKKCLVKKFHISNRVTCTRSGTSVICRSRVPLRAWVGPTVAKSRATISWRFVVVKPNVSYDDL